MFFYRSKTLCNCSFEAYFEREADSPKLLETLKTRAKDGGFGRSERACKAPVHRCSGAASFIVKRYRKRKTKNERISRQPGSACAVGHLFAGFQKGLYPNLSQYAANRAQTVQTEPNGVFSFQQLTSEPERNHPP
jgi:hypothetical protein